MAQRIVAVHVNARYFDIAIYSIDGDWMICRRRVDNPGEYTVAIHEIVQQACDLTDKPRIEVVGLSFDGIIRDNAIRELNGLSLWNGHDIRADLQDACEVPVVTIDVYGISTGEDAVGAAARAAHRYLLDLPA